MPLEKDLLVMTLPSSGPGTAAFALADAMSTNAADMVWTTSNLIDVATSYAETLRQVADQLPEPDSSMEFGSITTDPALDGVGNFSATTHTSPNISVAAITQPGDIGVANVVVPTLASAPTYTPTNLGFVWDESMWDMSLLTTAQAKLLSDFSNGGYGIEPNDEMALWQRAREREQIEGETAMQLAAQQAAARGFMLPPGVLYKQQQAAAQEAMEKNSSANRDIALKRADLYVQNRQFTFEMAAKVEQVLIEYVNAYYGRKLEALKANLEAYHISVEIYDAQVKAYLAQLSASETQVRIQIEAIDANVKTYVAKLSAYETILRTNIQKAELNIEQFKALLQQDSTVAETNYKSQHLRILAAEARIRQKQQAIENATRMNANRLGAYDSVSKLYLEPTNALAGIANAFIATTNSVGIST